MKEKILQLNNEKTIFWAVLGALFLCIGFYMYFINATVHNVVARQNLESEASNLTLKIGNQEFQYITSRNNVTMQLALSMGFKEVTAKTFISKNSNKQVSFATR
ncbi:MAG: hypothetical protein AB201_03060 [Parcubacteria bacterium C7867-006]|nr:MAG: hypothetical protein AB201_03060 [Parcubacteria bacterium C7867-006]